MWINNHSCMRVYVYIFIAVYIQYSNSWQNVTPKVFGESVRFLVRKEEPRSQDTKQMQDSVLFAMKCVRNDPCPRERQSQRVCRTYENRSARQNPNQKRTRRIGQILVAQARKVYSDADFMTSNIGPNVCVNHTTL